MLEPLRYNPRLGMPLQWGLFYLTQGAPQKVSLTRAKSALWKQPNLVRYFAGRYARSRIVFLAPKYPEGRGDQQRPEELVSRLALGLHRPSLESRSDAVRRSEAKIPPSNLTRKIGEFATKHQVDGRLSRSSAGVAYNLGRGDRTGSTSTSATIRRPATTMRWT
jgi:hypothetical protein